MTAPVVMGTNAPVTAADGAEGRFLSAGDSPEISVIIVSWNVRELLRDCLQSLRAQASASALEVIVVDNSSRDGSADLVAKEFPDARLIRNPANRGFAAANNQALRIARGRYALLLNPDTLVLKDCFARTLAYADARPNAAVIGCQVLEAQGRVQRTCFRFPRPLYLLLQATGLTGLFPRSDLFNRAGFGSWERDTERDVDVVSGMFMLVRREAIEQVGLMDEDYFVYAEEADWCYRFWKHGWRCVFAPVGQIIHRDGGSHSTGQMSTRMFVQQQKSLLLFHRKNRGWCAWALAKLLVMASMIPRYLVWSIRGAIGNDPRSAHQAHCARAALVFHLSGRPATP